MAERLLPNLRTHLITAGIVRDPTATGALPPMWLDPKQGTPAPGEGQGTEISADAVVGAYLNPAGGIPARPFESSLRADIVEFRLRTKTAPRAVVLEKAIRAALIDRRNFDLAALRVVDCEEWRALTRLATRDDAYEYLFSYVFWLYA